MNPSREEALFALALEKPAEKRAAFVDAECKGDPDLRQRLDALLAAHEEPESVAGPNKWLRLDDEPAPAEQVGSLVGGYTLLEKLGVGGFGEVWAAEQKEPVRRRVALKVIKLGMDTRQVVARFEAERQALAMMDHPNIARVLDAGATDTGRPYFVMDLVEGISITEYCEDKKLDLASRLDLFIKVCHAIQHALDLHVEVLGEDHPATRRLIYSLGLAYNWHLQPDKGESLLVTALDRALRVPGGENLPGTSGLTIVLAYCYRGLNQPEKAEPLARKAVELRRSTLGPGHPLTLSSLCILSSIHVMQQQFDKAKPLTEEVLDRSRGLPLEKDVFAALNLSMLGWFYLEQDDIARADTLCDLAWQTIGKNPAANPLNNPLIIAHLGAVRLALQNYTEATTLLREGLRLSEKRDLHTGWRFYVMSLLGASLSGQKNYDDAEPLLRQGYAGLVQPQASMPPYLNAPRRITEALERLVQLYDAWGKPAQAAEWKQKLTAFQQANKAAGKKGAEP